MKKWQKVMTIGLVGLTIVGGSVRPAHAGWLSAAIKLWDWITESDNQSCTTSNSGEGSQSTDR